MQVLNKIASTKKSIRNEVTGFFYFITCSKFDSEGEPTNPNKIYKICFGLLIYRIICKNIYAIACLGVLGCAIALPFVSQLQSFLHLNHFVKLIFENNLRAIAKLTSVAVFSLPFIIFYLAQVIVSIKKLNHAINVEAKCRDSSKRDYASIVRDYRQYESKKDILKDI
jgi:hypothetical protein